MDGREPPAPGAFRALQQAVLHRAVEGWRVGSGRWKLCDPSLDLGWGGREKGEGDTERDPSELPEQGRKQQRRVEKLKKRKVESA